MLVLAAAEAEASIEQQWPRGGAVVTAHCWFKASQAGAGSSTTAALARAAPIIGAGGGNIPVDEIVALSRGLRRTREAKDLTARGADDSAGPVPPATAAPSGSRAGPAVTHGKWAAQEACAYALRPA